MCDICLVYDILKILEYGFTGEIIKMLMCFISTFNPIYELFEIRHNCRWNPKNENKWTFHLFFKSEVNILETYVDFFS